MSINEEVEHLKRIPLFCNVDPSRLKLLAFSSDRVEFADGETLFRQGDSGDYAYVIMRGQVEVIVETQKGSERVGTIGQNEIVGEVAILRDQPRSATIRAAKDTTTLKIEKETFVGLVLEYPQLAIETLRVLAERLDRTTVRLREEIAKNP